MNDIAAELYTKLNETTIAFTIPIFGGIPVPESRGYNLGDNGCSCLVFYHICPKPETCAKRSAGIFGNVYRLDK